MLKGVQSWEGKKIWFKSKVLPPLTPLPSPPTGTRLLSARGMVGGEACFFLRGPDRPPSPSPKPAPGDLGGQGSKAPGLGVEAMQLTKI